MTKNMYRNFPRWTEETGKQGSFTLTWDLSNKDRSRRSVRICVLKMLFVETIRDLMSYS